MASRTTRCVEQKVDVFLCHAGEQKSTIVSHLDAALRRVGFTVFLDVKDIVMGQTADQTIYPALTSAWAVVILLSLDFVGKDYPLKELGWAMRNKERAVPVFFGITRNSCLKLLDADTNATQEQSTVLNKLQACTQDPDKLRKWKQDLVEIAKVGNIDPKDPNAPLASEAQLVDRVVQEVIRITGQPLLRMPQCPIGLHGDDGRVEKLVQQLPKSGKLGLFGEGGIGKTTLAHAMFNKLAAQFPCAYAVCEVGMEHESKVMLKCANNILNQLCRPEISALCQVHEGLLKGRKVLLLLDNLWHQDQIKQMVEPLLGGLAAGSIILCTSRSEDLLSSIKDMDCREVHSLDHLAANRLFHWHAFGSDDADLPLPPAIQTLHAQVLEVCAGMPLALEVAGSFIYKNRDKKFDVKTWQQTIACLAGPKDGVMERILNLSLGCLGENKTAVNMFFDIACFLRGESKAEALAAWFGVYDAEIAEVALNDLLSLTLCKVDVEGRLTMHDLLCALGRKRSLQLADGRWEKQQWLWDCDGAFNILKKSEVSKRVRTLLLKQRNFTGVKAVPSCWSDLRFLGIDNCPQCWTMDSFPAGLQWVRCIGVDWVRLSDHLPSTELKIMILQQCSKLRSIPKGISSLTSLHTLDLSECSQLRSIPEGISALTSLRTLKLSRCSQLRSIPKGISALTSLQMLDLSCGDWKRTRSISDHISAWTTFLTGLLALDPVDFIKATMGRPLTLTSQLRSIPEGISALTNLQTLNLSRCTLLCSIPEGISGLTSLRTLKLRGCHQLRIPEGISALTNLQVLKGEEKFFSMPQLKDYYDIKIETT